MGMEASRSRTVKWLNEISLEEMDACRKEWELAGYTVHEFDHTPVHSKKANIWVSGSVDHPEKVWKIEQVDALYTYRGDHYSALFLEGKIVE